MDIEDFQHLISLSSDLIKKLDENLDHQEQKFTVYNFLRSVKTISLPDFPKGMEWFNVAQELSFSQDLNRKIVLLDFFTYCCINCMHILPDLKEMEKKFPIEKGVVVIGVHNAKFDNEKSSDNIAAAVQRFNITHPVINDSKNILWNTYRISCWPTILILGPLGNPILYLMGEGHRDMLETFLIYSVEYYNAKLELSKQDIPLEPCYYRLPEKKGPLLFPGKITSFKDDKNGVELIAISDTGNHRVLIIQPDGLILHAIGNLGGYIDGEFTVAKFKSPQGLAFQNANTLFVADTENHAIRKINLKEKTVETITGMGIQGHDKVGGEIGKNQILSSPWDIVIYKTPDLDLSFHEDNTEIEEKDVLLIAMAGTHQIWALFLETTIWWKFKKYHKYTCIAIAGTGCEENRNNHYPLHAGFAQPSGLAICKATQELFVADSESSSIRRISLYNGSVTHVVGGNKDPTDLFTYGDEDGILYEAKLQHPIGLAFHEQHQFLVVADTFNHKLRKINTLTNAAITWNYINQEQFNLQEPSGLCFSNDGKQLYISDTNNHCIKVIPIDDKQELGMSTNLNLRVENLEKKINSVVKENYSLAKAIVLSTTGSKIIIKVSTTFLDGYKLPSDAQFHWTVLLPNETWSSFPETGTSVTKFDTVINVPDTNLEHEYKLYIELQFMLCGNKGCLYKHFNIVYDIKTVKDAPDFCLENVKMIVGDTVVVKND